MPAKIIVAGTDGSEESLRAVEWAARETARREAALRIVSVPVTWPYAVPRGKFSQVIAPEIVAEAEREDAERALADAAKRAAWLAPALRVDTAIIDGPPAQALLDAAADASLLVVGSRGAGGFAGMMLGSVSRYVATHAPCPSFRLTKPAIIREAIGRKIANAALIKPNQVGTVTETLEAMRICREAGWAQMVSHRSGETEDTFIADLAAGTGCGQIKSGAPARGERTAKYNRLIEIESVERLPYGLRD